MGSDGYRYRTHSRACHGCYYRRRGSVARMAVPHAGIGEHTVELVDPTGCYGEDVVVCQVDAMPDPEWDALCYTLVL